MMQSLFESALSIESPWFIRELEFSSSEKRLDIFIDFKRGSRFSLEVGGNEFPVHDTVEKKWRHLNFFEHECYLHCRVPRVRTDDNQVKQVSPPWSGKSLGFTLLFEALLLQLCSTMPVNAVAKLVNVSDDKLWTMLDRYVDLTRCQEDFSDVTAVGIDETSRSKGHNYITLFVDLDQRKTIFVTEGKDSKTVEQFASDFKAHNGDISDIEDVSCDMSPAFIKGVKEHLPNAEITFDKFHVVKLINEAVDEVRRGEVGQNPILKGTKYVVLKNNSNLTTAQQKTLQELSKQKHNLKTYRALRIREAFQDLYRITSYSLFVQRLKEWYSWARRSRIEPIKEVAKTIKNHWDGVVRWRKTGLSNGILEGLNSLIQAAKSKARGYKTTKNLVIIAYLVTANLHFERVNKNFTP